MGFNAPYTGIVSGRGGGGKGGGSGGKESPNTLRSKATARILDLLGEGEIKGLVNGAKSIYMDETPLMSESGDYNFEGVQWTLRTGLPEQSIVPGANGVEALTNVGVEVKQGAPVTRTLTDPDYDACIVTIRIPALSKADDKGNIKPSSIQYRIDIRYSGGSWNTTTGVVTLSGKCVSPYDKQYYFKLPKNPSGESAPWEIRVTRITADSESVKLQNATYFSSYEGIIEAKFTYPNSAYVGMVIDAEQFNQSIPARSYLVDGRIILVPSNYTTRLYDVDGNISRAAAYTGEWDGTFIEAWSNNPAWVFYDMITNDRFGLGDYIDTSQVDKWGLYEIAKYCDELVPDGSGGEEPRMTFNGVISEKREAYDTLATMANCFRGMAYWSSGSIMTTQDTPKDPAISAGPANVIDGNFSRNSSGLKARHTVAFCKFNDPKEFYKTGYATYQDADGILKYGYRDTQIVATGCTSRGQAYRMAKWTVLTELFETQTITYQAGFDHAGIRPGDIIAVQDPSFSGVDYSGRFAEGNTSNVLMLDIPVSYEVGKQYWLSAQMPDGKIEERQIVVSQYDVDTTVVVVSPAFSAAPDAEAMWVVSRTDVVPELYRCITIKESEPNVYDVMGLQYEPSKFAAVDEDAAFEPIDTSALPTGALPRPTAMAFNEYPFAVAEIGTVIALDWSITVPKDPRIASFEWQMQTPEDGGIMSEWKGVGSSYEPILTLQSLEQGTYNFRVRALSTLGGSSAWLTQNGVALLGTSLPPPDVDLFRISVLADQAFLSWTIGSMLNVSYFEIRHTPITDNPAWNSATIIVEHASGTSVQLPVLEGTYLIKAVSFGGRYSVAAKMLQNTVSGSNLLNAVENFVEQPLFPGTKTHLTIQDIDLRLAQNGTNGFYPEGIYEFADVLDLGQNYTSRLTATIQVYGVDTRDTMSTWTSLATLEALSGATSDLWDLAVEYAVTNDDPTGTPTWSAWETFITGDVNFRAIKFRARLLSLDPAVTPSVRRLEINVDMPDRIFSGKDITVPTSGLTINFDPPFKSLKGLSVADQDMATGDRREITAKDRGGFTIRYYNSAGTAISRTFDYNAVGYGVAQ